MDCVVQVVRNVNIALTGLVVHEIHVKVEELSKLHVFTVTQEPQDLQNCEYNI